MQPAGARPLREDEQQTARTGGALSLVEPEDRAAVLLQWERKIEQEERRSRFAREKDERDEPGAKQRATAEARDGVELRPAEERLDAEPDEPVAGRRFARPAPVLAPAPEPTPAPVAERRTVTISGRPDPLPRRPRQSVAVRHIAAQPDRLALWAFLLCLFLLAVAFGTAHA
jgi:hypothetical protein